MRQSPFLFTILAALPPFFVTDDCDQPSASLTAQALLTLNYPMFNFCGRGARRSLNAARLQSPVKKIISEISLNAKNRRRRSPPRSLPPCPRALWYVVQIRQPLHEAGLADQVGRPVEDRERSVRYRGVQVSGGAERDQRGRLYRREAIQMEWAMEIV